METLRSPFENILNIISGLPHGHEKPLKHALYNAVALLLLCLCCAATWALYIILEPFVKPLIWALLVGSVLHPLKYTLATKFRVWFKKLEHHRTPLLIGVMMLPVNLVNDLSECIGSQLLKRLKMIAALLIVIPFMHLVYYYTPQICVCVTWRLATYTYATIQWIIDISTTKMMLALFTGYISLLAIWWKPATKNHFHYASIVMWLFVSSYLSQLCGTFQITIFTVLQFILCCGFVFQLISIHNEMRDSGKHITYMESALWALKNKLPDRSAVAKAEIGDGAFVLTDRCKLKLLTTTKSVQRSSIAHPLIEPVSNSSSSSSSVEESNHQQMIIIINTESLQSDTYLYVLFWGCIGMIFWKNITLLPLLPLPVIVYVSKHVGLYLGAWQWIAAHLNRICENVCEWCSERYDAFIPAPVCGLYNILLSFNGCMKDVIEDSIDTVSSVIVILALIIFAMCFSIFFAIQIYGEAIMLVQTTSNVINSTVVHNPELRQLLPPSLDETLDSVLDNAYVYGREGITKLVRSMMSDVDVTKSEKLEQQVLELWDRVYQAWMSSDQTTGPQVTNDAVHNSWQTFLHDIRTSPGVMEFVKQNIGTFMSVLESLWSILKGNLTILVGSFSALLSILLGGGTAVLNFILNVIVFLTTLFYLLSSSGTLYKPVDLITNFSPYNGNRFGVAFEAAVNSVFKASFKMALFYGLWTWFIHNLFAVKIVYLSSALATILGAVPFLGTYWACIPAVLDLWLAQNRTFQAILLAIFQFLPTMLVDTVIYKEIKGGHPYLTGLAIAGGIFCLGFEGAIIGPLLLCGLYVVIDLSSSMFKETPSEHFTS